MPLSCLLQFASDDLRADREIVLAAVKNEGCALRFAELSLRSDSEIVMAAVANDYRALYFVSAEFHMSREMVLTTMHDIKKLNASVNIYYYEMLYYVDKCGR